MDLDAGKADLPEIQPISEPIDRRGVLMFGSATTEV
jgi:hypothetical protein